MNYEFIYKLTNVFMNFTFQRYTISHKVEHQATLGAEVMTRKELADEWISTLIRPGSRLARIRFDPLANVVLAYETKSLKQLTENGAEVGFQPGEALGNLHSLFNDLIAAKLTPGWIFLDFWFKASKVFLLQSLNEPFENTEVGLKKNNLEWDSQKSCKIKLFIAWEYGRWCPL